MHHKQGKNQYRATIIWVVFCLLLAGWVGRAYLGDRFPYTHDGENHLARFANYKLALKEGQFPPRWAPNLLNHYGYPVFNFNYPLANILSLPFSLVKLHYELTFKLLVIGALFFMSLGVGVWQRHTSRSWVAVLTLMVSPVLLSMVMFRGSIGELLALALLPWALWSIDVLAGKPWSRSRAWASGIIIWTGLFLAHNVTLLMCLPLLGWYILVEPERRRAGITLACLSGLLSLWFWLPALVEKQQVVLGDAQLSQQYQQHFLSVHELILGPTQFGYSFLGHIDSAGFAVGLAGLFVLVTATVWAVVGLGRRFTGLPLLTDKITFPTAWIVWSWVLLLLQLSWSMPIWNLLPLSNFVQFPWRLSNLWLIVMLPVVTWWWQNFSRSWRIFFLFLLLLQAWGLHRLRAVDFFHREKLAYEQFTQSTSTGNENLVKGFRFPVTGEWSPTPQLTAGSGEVTVQLWRGTYRQYQLKLTEPATVIEPTMFFSGWRTQVSDTLSGVLVGTLQYIDNDEIQGRIAYHLPAGEYSVVTRFTQRTWSRMLGNTVSLITCLVLLLWFAWPNLKVLHRRLWRKLS